MLRSVTSVFSVVNKSGIKLNGKVTERSGPRFLVCGANWIGDAVMSMPALQAFRRAVPEARITMLVKRSLEALWTMHPAVDAIEVLSDTFAGAQSAAARLGALEFSRAYVFPNSFRAALVPFMARIPERIGAAGHWRRAMLTNVVSFKASSLRRHQAFEYFDILGLETAGFEVPRLAVPLEAMAAAQELMGEGNPSLRVGLFPGAARGPSKRWPATHFGRVGARFTHERNASVVVFGSPSEEGLCGEVARDAGTDTINLAGRTTLPVLAGALKACDLVLCNDSGGMHLAAAVGTPVVAIYGTTDPSRTGPLGTRRKIIQESSLRSRDIARSSAEAERALASIDPDRVFEDAIECLELFRKRPEIGNLKPESGGRPA